MKTSDLLQQLHPQTISIIEAVKTQFISLPESQLNFKPLPDRWSILECFEHLNIYNQYYLTATEAAVASARQTREGEMRYTWIGKKSVAMMHPSNTKKQKTFKKMIPGKSRLTHDVLHTFLNDQQRILALIKNASAVDAVKAVVPVEFFRLLKMNIAETLEFVVVHEERHLLQAQRVFATMQSNNQPALSV